MSALSPETRQLNKPNTGTEGYSVYGASLDRKNHERPLDTPAFIWASINLFKSARNLEPIQGLGT